MKKAISIIAGLVVLLACHKVHARPAGGDTSLLWQISGKGLPKSSYLFGTIHLICPTDHVWTTTMQQTLDKSEKVCLELDMSAMGLGADDDLDEATMANMNMMLDFTKALSEYFTPQQYKQLEKYVRDSLNMSPSMILMLKPVTMLMLITQHTASPCDAPLSYEADIMHRVAGKKEMMGLETMFEQFKALETIPADSAVKYILESMDDKKAREEQEEYRKMITAYKSQDIATLHTMIASSGQMGTSAAALLDDRNKKWIDRMAGMMHGSSVFFAVGAGHLAGPNGVISLLRKAGYTVTPLR
ncbi:TraB/GumN family protein [Nemorincola caseinilytica]|uniref:TraB/GumN family protein n=1 Tax=Nemorincola caseinilytica TaxID=2054315 RepID=A0ABP8NMR1_9BACT